VIAVKALVYQGPGVKAWEDVPDPVIQEATDAIVRVDRGHCAAPYADAPSGMLPGRMQPQVAVFRSDLDLAGDARRGPQQHAQRAEVGGRARR
jgi:hypothetical protein